MLISIFSAGRSGSTMLGRLLDGMPEVYVHPVESNFLCAFNDLVVFPIVRDRVRKNTIVGPLRMLDRSVSTTRLLRYYAYHVAEVEGDLLREIDGQEWGPEPLRALRRQPLWELTSFVPSLLEAFRRWLQPTFEPSHYLFKTIETPYIADYERLFPNMRFIHIIRDPVEMWASQKRTLVVKKSCPPWYLGMDNLRSSIEYRWLPHAQAIVERQSSKKHFLVLYESLVEQPQHTIAALTDWLGLKPPPQPTIQTVLGGKHPRRMISYPSQPGLETPREVTAGLEARRHYRNVLTDRERDLIALRTWDLARQLGMLANTQYPDPASVRQKWKAVDSYDFMHSRGLLSKFLAGVSFIRRRRYVNKICS
jgi:hypothetical protein